MKDMELQIGPSVVFIVWGMSVAINLINFCMVWVVVCR